MEQKHSSDLKTLSETETTTIISCQPILLLSHTLCLFPGLQEESNTAISGHTLVPKLSKSSHLLTMHTNKGGENESETHPQGPPFNSSVFLVNSLPVFLTGALEIPAMTTALTNGKHLGT